MNNEETRVSKGEEKKDWDSLEIFTHLEARKKEVKWTKTQRMNKEIGRKPKVL